MTKMVFWNCPVTTHNRGVKKQTQNTTERLTVLGQFCKLIPKYSLASHTCPKDFVENRNISNIFEESPPLRNKLEFTIQHLLHII